MKKQVTEQKQDEQILIGDILYQVVDENIQQTDDIKQIKQDGLLLDKKVQVELYQQGLFQREEKIIQDTLSNYGWIWLKEGKLIQLHKKGIEFDQAVIKNQKIYIKRQINSFLVMEFDFWKVFEMFVEGNVQILNDYQQNLQITNQIKTQTEVFYQKNERELFEEYFEEEMGKQQDEIDFMSAEQFERITKSQAEKQLARAKSEVEKELQKQKIKITFLIIGQLNQIEQVEQIKEQEENQQKDFDIINIPRVGDFKIYELDNIEEAIPKIFEFQEWLILEQKQQFILTDLVEGLKNDNKILSEEQKISKQIENLGKVQQRVQNQVVDEFIPLNENIKFSQLFKQYVSQKSALESFVIIDDSLYFLVKVPLKEIILNPTSLITEDEKFNQDIQEQQMDILDQIVEHYVDLYLKIGRNEKWTVDHSLHFQQKQLEKQEHTITFVFKIIGIQLNSEPLQDELKRIGIIKWGDNK